jgi:hypothetical protein
MRKLKILSLLIVSLLLLTACYNSQVPVLDYEYLIQNNLDYDIYIDYENPFENPINGEIIYTGVVHSNQTVKIAESHEYAPMFPADKINIYSDSGLENLIFAFDDGEEFYYNQEPWIEEEYPTDNTDITSRFTLIITEDILISVP